MISTELLRKIRQIEIRTRHLVEDSLAGEYHSVFKGRGMSFDEVRPYLPGDEIRSIDWNVTARMGHPYVKRYVEERELTVMLMVDVSASGAFGSVRQFKRELAAELTAVLAFAATTNNDRVGLLIFTDKVERFVAPRKGRKHVLRLVRELLTFEPVREGTDIEVALNRVNRMLKRRSILFVLSDFLCDPDRYARALAVTNRRHDLIAFDLYDPLEQQIADVGLLALEDAETGALVWIDSSSARWRTAFAERLAAAEQAKRQLFRRCQVDHIALATNSDYMPALMHFFHKRKR